MTRLQPFSLDVNHPLGTAAGEIRSREGFLVGIGDSDRGVGEATPLPGWTESLDACEQALRNPPAGWEEVSAFDIGMSETPAARHGYRLAVLDAEARARSQPLATLLAEAVDFPESSDSVPVNATVGDGPVRETVAAARAAVERGFDCLKLKVGARPLETDIERVSAVGEAVDATLRVDANGAWNGAEAHDAVEAFASLGVEYVEQPVPARALSLLAALRGKGVDIAADESLGELGVDAVLEADAADVAVLKPMALGGPDAAVAAAGELRQNGIEPVVTTTIDGAIARAATVHVAAAIPNPRACGLATGELLREDLGPDPVPVVDGRITVPDGPGNLGETFDGRLWRAEE
ncbi:mandelate racemase/muconate lactonizing enzyme family protein [Halolamina sp.]|jgi:o-succinylbenzoate synthase|uniref:mandelate racemase/muconate lactonizing enzyme family protein n=1 Tax=Halolamina sp. TaxID=1940283 RepID=UPI000223B92F|nr:Mandelate racemase/muconate lactonizing protein [halophilic archaeon DL31]